MAWGIAITGITLMGMAVLLLAEILSTVGNEADAADATAEAAATEHAELDKAA